MIDTHSGRLAGKTALITGAASVRGIGFAAARRFAREGCAVYLADLDAAPLAERTAEITAAGGEATALAFDVSDEVQWRDALARIDGLDILVNNAGILRLDPIEQIAQADCNA